MQVYPTNHYHSKKAFKEAIKKSFEKMNPEDHGVQVYDVGVRPILRSSPETVVKQVNGKKREVIMAVLTGPNPFDRKWYAQVALDANAFRRGELRVVWAK